MTASTLPRVVATDQAFPTYFIRSAAGETLRRISPTLPSIPGFRWAEPYEVADPHAELDVLALAHLFFAANVDPDSVQDDAVVDLIDNMLTVCHCDLGTCAEETWLETGAHPEVACPRWRACIVRASKLRGVSV